VVEKKIKDPEKKIEKKLDNKPKKDPVYREDKNIISITIKANNYDITKFYTRTWIDSKKKPYKYEFRGDYAAYYNPEELEIIKTRSRKNTFKQK
jgi:hypothetical protein